MRNASRRMWFPLVGASPPPWWLEGGRFDPGRDTVTTWKRISIAACIVASATLLGASSGRVDAAPMIGDTTSSSRTKPDPGETYDDTSCVFAIDGVSSIPSETVTIGPSQFAYVVFRCYFAYVEEIYAGTGSPHIFPAGTSGSFSMTPVGGTATGCAGCYFITDFGWDDVTALGDGQALAEGHFNLGRGGSSRTISGLTVHSIGATSTSAFGDGFVSKVGGGSCSVAWFGHGCALSLGGASIGNHGVSTYVSDDAFAAGAFPPYHFGGVVYEGPLSVCDTLDVDMEVRRAGAGNPFTALSSLGVVLPGDVLRLTMTSSVLPVAFDHLEADETVVIGFRWSPGDPWTPTSSQLARTYSDPDWPVVSMTIVRLASDGPVPASAFSLRCNSTVTLAYDYWAPIGAWGADGSGTSGCRNLTMTVVEFDILGNGSLLKSPDEWSQLLTDDALVDVEVGGAPPGVSVVLEYRGGNDPEWYPLGTLAEDFEPPGSIQFGVGTHHSWLHPHEIQFRCSDVGGRYEFDPETGDFVRPDPTSGDGFAESCYGEATSDMSLTSPASWVRGAGRMGVCLVEYLFVPSDGAVGEAWGDVEDTAATAAPLSWVVNSYVVVEDTTSGLPGAVEANEGDCITWLESLEPWGISTDASARSVCPQALTDSGGALHQWSGFRPFLGLTVFVLWAVWLGGLAFGGSKQADDGPTQLSLF